MDSQREDHELISQFLATHNPGLREEIILRYVPLVHFVLGRLGLSQGMGQDYEDAASQGLLGLIEAVDRYDPSYKTQFSTYATLRIRGNIIDALRTHDWLSRGARQRAKKLQEAVMALWEKLSRAPNDDEIASFMNIDSVKLRQSLMDSSHVIVSLDALVAGESNENVSLYELLPDEKQAEPSDLYEEEEQKERLIECIKALPEREQLVLSFYYYEELTLKEIGVVLDITESRVSQIHSKAILKLRSKVQQRINA